ncbi:MAG: hypothetical protein AAGF11_30400 [Myxococcota bacterium]
MLSLPQVLHEAQRHSVDEIAIERGEPVTFHGEQGALILGEELSDSDISEALSQVLAPEQQAELAVAGVVEFYVEGYAEWSLVAETAVDGVVIRGRIREGDSPSEVGAPLDLPPLRPFEPDPGTDMPPSSDSVLHQTGHRATRWDMGIAGDMLEPDPVEPSEAAPEAAPEATPETTPETTPVSARLSTSAVLLPDDQPQMIDFALVGGPGVPSDDELPAPAPPRTTAAVARASEPAFAPRLTSRPTLRSGAGPGPTEAKDEAKDEDEAEVEAEVDLAMETTVPKLTPGPRPAVGSAALEAHSRAVEPGTVVYLAGVAVGEGLLESVSGGFTVVDDETWATVTTMSFEELPLDHAYLVRLEDPSRCLPWLLRRLEEGARIVVEGRAKTSAGARRTLLGAEATAHLVRWLDAHPQRWLCPDGSGWRLESL